MSNFSTEILRADELVPFKVLKGSALAILVSWTMAANCLVFVVLYKNPRLQTVPNLLVGNLAFSDLCLGFVVLPLSAIYAIAEKWVFGRITCEIWLSSDILCCTASIWNLSMIGLDRYWAITSPVTYMNKRNKRSAGIMISCVWILSSLISLAPFFGWKRHANTGNHRFDNITQTYQCLFLDLPAYTVYSATGSFFLPTIVMFFVYTKIYQAFADHKARQIYRQKVIRKHIESTILHEISHVLPTSDEFAKSDDDDYSDEDDEDDSDEFGSSPPPIIEEDEGERCIGELEYNQIDPSPGPTSILVRPGSKRQPKSAKFSSESRQSFPRLDSQTGSIGTVPNRYKKASRTKSVDVSERKDRNVSIPDSIGGIKLTKKLVRIRTNSKTSLMNSSASADEHKPLTPRSSGRSSGKSSLRKSSARSSRTGSQRDFS